MMQIKLRILYTHMCCFRCCGVHLSPSKLKHITSNKFGRASQLLNAVAFLNNLADTPVASTDAIEYAAAVLQSVLPETDGEVQKKLAFLLEQLDLCLKTPKQRRYSSFLLATAMMWQMTSPALYNQLRGEDVLSLPSVRHLKRLSSALTVDGTLSESTCNYLKIRLSTLEPRERVCAIILDEVYSAKRVEFAGGKLYGLEDDADVSKTLLCFMVKSVASNYRDMVAMQPISKIDAGVIEKNFLAVLKTLSELGFDVVCVSTDGHSSNRKFYEQLSGGKILPSIPHPCAPEKRIFLLFDTVHLFKNYYTNFLNRTFLIGPSFEGKPRSANFNHISQLYHKELGLPVKAAHKLTQKVLSPRPIERANVMLPERLFHESTIAGLRFYSDSLPEWKDTADLLEVFHHWWSIVNVRSMNIGIRKRNDQKKPVTSSDCDNIKFLESFSTWLLQWKDLGDKKTCLTRETMFCAIQTSTALPLLAKYLMDVKEFRFVLLGKISSDAIEHRFGHYRQLAGANYFLSVRQFLGAEKAIRLKSLVKYSRLSMPEVIASLSDVAGSQPEVQLVIDELLNFMEEESLEIEFSEDREDAILYFVSGYIAKALLKKTQCKMCVDMICESRDMPPVRFYQDTNSAPDARSSFLDQINRGGLVKPSDLVFIYCLHANELQHRIFASEEMKKVFLSAELPRPVFAGLLRQKLENNFSTRQLLETECSVGHDFSSTFSRIATTFCNCMLKNFVSELNDKLHEARKRGPNSQESTPANRKIAKLQNK
jgi:hypothetical protein